MRDMSQKKPHKSGELFVAFFSAAYNTVTSIKTGKKSVGDLILEILLESVCYSIRNCSFQFIGQYRFGVPHAVDKEEAFFMGPLIRIGTTE